MFDRVKYDVLIVGARCAGAATAMLLARSGLSVLAVERGDYGADTLSTHALMRGGVLQLKRWGVLPRIVAADTPAIRRTAFHYEKEITEIPIRPDAGVDALYAPRRTVLDRALVDMAREAGAEVCHACTVSGVSRDRSGRVRGAVIQHRDGSWAEIAADLVVGADGAGSTIARLVDAPVTRAATNASAIIHGHFAGLPDTGYRWHYRAGLSAGIIPTNGGQHCVFVAMPPGRYREQARPDLAAFFHRILGEIAPEAAARIARSRPETRLWTFLGRKGYLKQARGAGWALVGDAGYLKDPLTAHGITDALRDAELLAMAAVHGSEVAFRGYEAVRDDLSAQMLDVTDAIASFTWTIDGLRSLHVTLNQAMKREVECLAALANSPSSERNPCQRAETRSVTATQPVREMAI